MNAKLAERYALIAWEAIVGLMASEAAAQHSIMGTPKDFENFAVEHLIQAFIIGKAPPLQKRIDAERFSARDEDTGDHFFDIDKTENLEGITYTQGLISLRDKVPHNLRLKYKQLHAHGSTPWEAYSEVVAEWARMRDSFSEVEGVRTNVRNLEHITDGAARQLLSTAPLKVRTVYGQKMREKSTPGEALTLALRGWNAGETG